MINDCILCKECILEENGKLKGTILKAKNEKGKNEFIYVCSNCQKDPKHIEKAKVKAA